MLLKVLKIAASFILIFAFVFILEACGGSQMNKQQPSASDSPAVPANNQAASNAVQSGGVSLPEGYPADLVPVMEDAESGWGMASGGGFNLSYSTPSSGDKVLAFYSDHFAKYGDAVAIADGNREINLVAEGRSINILIDDSSKSTSLRISIGAADASESGENSVVEETAAPDETAAVEYPKEIVPLIDGAQIIDLSGQKEGNGISYSATVQVNKSFAETTAFYKSVLEAIPGSSVEASDTELYGNAVAGSNSIEIQIVENSDSDCMVMINIYPQ